MNQSVPKVDAVKLIVRRFVLRGAVDRPEQGVDRVRLAELMDDLLAAHPEGFTIEQLHDEVAGAVTLMYRRAGFFLARAFIPEQEVIDGQVMIQVVEGTLGAVVVEGNSLYSEELLTIPLGDMVGQPVVQGNLESGLLRINDYPGYAGYAVFTPGAMPGTTDLVLKTGMERFVEAGIWFDNVGSDYTGEYRAQLNLAVNNPASAGDRLAANLLQTLDPENGTFGSLRYQRPLFDLDNTFSVAYSRNSFSVGRDLEAQDIEGVTDIGSLAWERHYMRRRVLTIGSRLELQRKRARTTQLNVERSRDDLTVASIGFNLESSDQWLAAGINQGQLLYARGIAGWLGAMEEGDGRASRAAADGEAVGGDFDKVTLSCSRLQFLPWSQRLYLRFQGQYSNDPLVSLEQMALGGAASVRAYPTAETLADKGLFAAIEWILPMPGVASRAAFAGRTWGDLLHLSLFVDYAVGRINEPLPEEEKSVELAGAGLGLQFSLPGSFQARIDGATPLGSRKASSARDLQIFFSLGYDL